jgi:molybdate transport system permease protein
MSDLEREVISLSVKTALVSTALIMPVAVWLGFVFARKHFPLKSLAEALVSIPLTAPPVVTGYLLLRLLGRNSALGGAIFELFGVRLTFNFAALVIASMTVSLPLSVRAIRSAFTLVNPSYEQASRTLGASRIATFFRVSLPLAAPGLISGAVLAFARSLGEFGATITLAGNIAGKTQTAALLIYSHMQVPGKEAEVMRLTVFCIALAFVALIVSERLGRPRRTARK